MKDWVVVLPEELTPGGVESIMTAASPPVDRVFLDARRCSQISAGAGELLVNALAKHRDGELHVAVRDEFGSKSWFMNITRSGLGHLIARRATRVISASGEDLLPRVREYYDQLADASSTFVFIPDIVSPARVATEDVQSFGLSLFGWLTSIGTMDPAAKETVAFRGLRDLCFQAVQNAYDHAAKMPLRQDADVFAYFSIRRYGGGELVASDAMAPGIGVYLRELQRTFETQQRGEPGLPRSGFLEIVVSDDGSGIAGRHDLNMSIYRGEPLRERDVLLDALKDGSTVKLRARDAPIRAVPGTGFTVISDALRALRGFAALRSGRLVAAMNGLSDSDEFLLGGTPTWYMPGTLLHVLVPVTPRPRGSGADRRTARRQTSGPLQLKLNLD